MSLGEMTIIIQAMKNAAEDKGLHVNGVIVGQQLIEEVQTELLMLFRPPGKPKDVYREVETILGIQLIRDFVNRRKIRLTFDEHTWDEPL